MALKVEVLIPKKISLTAKPFLHAMANAIRTYGDSVTVSEDYRQMGDWLVLYGVGAPGRSDIRHAQLATGGRVIMWDLGYFGRLKYTGYLRCSVDTDHPPQWFDRTPPNPSRFGQLKIQLRDSYDPNGHIVLVGLGPKSRSYLNEPSWEEQKLAGLRARFPDRKIFFRPKPNNLYPDIKADLIDCESPIQDVLKGASLVVCRHSNVAVDAVVANVPYEAEDGAAMWLVGKPYTRENRLDFLYRLAWWQWRSVEAFFAWQFIRKTVR
jgi:hypothetical protein